MHNLSLELTIPLLIIIGFGVSTMASAIGIGGGIVAIPFVLLVIGTQNSHQAKLIIYVLIVALSLFGVYKYFQMKQKPDLKSSFFLLLGTVPMSIICLIFVDPKFADVPKWVFSACYTGIILMVLIIINTYKKISLKKPAPLWTLPIMGGLIGVLAGSFGISGGILFVPVLLIAVKKTPKEVAVNSLVLKLVTSVGEIITGLISNNGYRQFESAAMPVYWWAPLIIIVGAAVGSQIGPLINKRMTQKQVIISYNVALITTLLWQIALSVLMAKGIL